MDLVVNNDQMYWHELGFARNRYRSDPYGNK